MEVTGSTRKINSCYYKGNKYYKRNLGEKISLAYEQVNMEVHIRHQVEQAGQFMSLDFRGEN